MQKKEEKPRVVGVYMYVDRHGDIDYQTRYGEIQFELLYQASSDGRAASIRFCTDSVNPMRNKLLFKKSTKKQNDSREKVYINILTTNFRGTVIIHQLLQPMEIYFNILLLFYSVLRILLI